MKTLKRLERWMMNAIHLHFFIGYREDEETKKEHMSMEIDFGWFWWIYIFIACYPEIRATVISIYNWFI